MYFRRRLLLMRAVGDNGAVAFTRFLYNHATVTVAWLAGRALRLKLRTRFDLNTGAIRLTGAPPSVRTQSHQSTLSALGH